MSDRYAVTVNECRAGVRGSVDLSRPVGEDQRFVTSASKRFAEA
ncbi:MAG: hypothetical protein PGN13_01730 [Patulibacter minatonensis]